MDLGATTPESADPSGVLRRVRASLLGGKTGDSALPGGKPDGFPFLGRKTRRFPPPGQKNRWFPLLGRKTRRFPSPGHKVLCLKIENAPTNKNHKKTVERIFKNRKSSTKRTRGNCEAEASKKKKKPKF